MQVKLLNNEISARIEELFSIQLINPVELNYFTSEDQCNTCEEATQLFEELAALSDMLSFSTHDIEEHPELAKKFNIQHAPALAVCAREQDTTIDYGIRFLGIPSGYEFSSLIQAIGLVSKRDSGLKAETRKELQTLKVPLQLKVFVTPT